MAILTIIRNRGRGEKIRYTSAETDQPDKLALADRIHDDVMAHRPEYRAIQQTKAMAACIRWKNPPPPPIRVMATFSTATGEWSDRPIFTNRLTHDALNRCKGWAAAEKADCTCEMLDINEKNVLRVP